MKLLKTVFMFSSLLVATPLCGLAATICAIFDRKGRLWWPISRIWGWALISWGVPTRWGIPQLDVTGYEHVSIERGAILMSNHESYLDPPTLIYLSDIPIRFLTKKSLFYVPIFGLALLAVGHIPINRRNRSSAFSSLDKAAQTISKGKLVAIFPEGTRSPTNDLLPFKKGGFVIAIKGGIPIIPVGIAGTRRILPKGWTKVTTGPVSVVLGEPIDTTGLTLDDREALMTTVRERIEVLREEAEARRNTAEVAPG